MKTIILRPRGAGNDTARNRLSVYNEQAEPLLNYYCRQGLLRGIQGNSEIGKVQQDIINAIGKA